MNSKKLTHKKLLSLRKTQSEMEIIERFPIVTMLDNIRSLYNVGSIFRTSDAACIEKIFLTGFTPTPPRKEIEKTALGATKTIPWEYFENILTPVNNLKSKGYKIISVEMTNSSEAYNNLKLDHFPCCFIFGNEIVGVSPQVIEISDLCLQIPMHGLKHSLNVSVAYGIVLFEALRILKQK